jgi:hypothetical protein
MCLTLTFVDTGIQHTCSITCSSRHQFPPVSFTAAASRSSSPADDGNETPALSYSSDEITASTSEAAGGSSQHGSTADGTSQQQQPADSPFLALPLLVASSLSHVNRQYIKMRRRRKWWSKMGGYPKVWTSTSILAHQAHAAHSCSAAEPAVQLELLAHMAQSVFCRFCRTAEPG